MPVSFCLNSFCVNRRVAREEFILEIAREELGLVFSGILTVSRGVNVPVPYVGSASETYTTRQDGCGSNVMPGTCESMVAFA